MGVLRTVPRIAMKIPTWLWVLLGLLLLGGGAKVYTMSRGLRNNNPGNIKESPGDKTQWMGERATNDDPIFEEFQNMSDGVRAATRIFRNYQSQYGLNTIEGLISRWAPGNENDTAAYIKFVSDKVGIGPRTAINLSGPMLHPFLRAVFQFENGPAANLISQTDFETGIRNA